MIHEFFSTDMIPDGRISLPTQGRMRGTRTPRKISSLKSTIEYVMPEYTDTSVGVYVNTVGQQKILPNMTYPSKEHPDGYFFNIKEGRVLDEYQLVYITNGAGDFYTEKNLRGGVKVRGGYLLWLTPGQWHSYTPNIHTGWSEYYIGFKGEVVENMLRHSFLYGKNGAFDIGFNEELAHLFMRALDVARKKEAFYESYLSGIVLHMMGLVLSQVKEQMDRLCSNAQKIERAKIIIKENLTTNLDLEELATSLDMSYSWFRKQFKDYTGVGPAKYLLELRLNKAKELLITTSLSAKEIFYLFGQNTAESYHCAFKKSTGCTPMEYRRMMQERQAVG